MVKKTKSPDKKNSAAKSKLYENLSKTLLQFLAGKRYEPMGQLALFKRLQIPKHLYPLCKEIVADLLEKRAIEIQRKQLFLKKEKPDVITGVLRVHPRGFGFVLPDHPSQCPQDIFIPKQFLQNGVDGDRVEVTINPNSNWDKGPDGEIVSILQRGRTHLAGIIHNINTHSILAYVPLLGSSKPVLVKPSKKIPLKVGDRVILKVLRWSEDDEETTGEVSHLIGHISDASCDIPAAIEEFDLTAAFAAPALEEAKAMGRKVSTKDLKGRKDLTDLECFTIDPDTARDFDDALNLSKDKKGHYHLGVHIADVAHYVKPLSALDLEASERCNSTYFPGSCLPMLPEELSNNLCSLKANVIRLTASVLMEFDTQGNLLDCKIERAYIKSRRRFTYEEAKEVIDGKKKSPHAKSLNLMVELCLLLKKKRSERGSIDFALPDTVILVDEKGMPYGTKVVEYDISHQLVEEFMLKANEVVAKHLADRGVSLLFRIHEEPSQENFQDFFALARALGFSLPDKPTQKDLQKLFEEVKSTPFGSQLAVGFIRSMKLAFYSPENVGHYGLALEHYCHFTSPIRRYTDLIIQRILFEEEKKQEDLEKIALKCSEKERISFRAETQVKLLKKLRLLDRFYKEDPYRHYTASVTRIKPFGLFFEVPELMLEGFLHISELENDYFVFDMQRGILKGRSSGKVHKVGEKITVMASSVDLILLESKWALVSDAPRKGRS